MKKSELVQIIKEALTDKVKAVSVPASKLQKGDTMAADKAKITSIKKDEDTIEVTVSGGKKLNFKKDKQVQIVRAGSTLNENISPELEKKVNTFIKSIAKLYDYSEADAISGIKQVLAKRK